MVTTIRSGCLRRSFRRQGCSLLSQLPCTAFHCSTVTVSFLSNTVQGNRLGPSCCTPLRVVFSRNSFRVRSTCIPLTANLRPFSSSSRASFRAPIHGFMDCDRVIKWSSSQGPRNAWIFSCTAKAQSKYYFGIEAPMSTTRNSVTSSHMMQLVRLRGHIK